MKYERRLPASDFSAGELQLDMTQKVNSIVHIPGIEGKIAHTWWHERAHKAAFEGPGEYAYSLEIGMSSGEIFVGWIASFTPYIDDDTDPLKVVKSAMAPGVGDMSEQDKKVADHWWKIYLDQLKEQKLQEMLEQEKNKDKSGIQPEEVKPDKSINEDEFQKLPPREKLLEVFKREIDRMVGEGHFPDAREIMGRQFSDIVEKYGSELREAFDVACKESGFDFDLEENSKEDDSEDTENMEEDEMDGAISSWGIGVVYKAKQTEGIIN